MSGFKASFRAGFWDDLQESSNWYEEQQPGLSSVFRNEVLAAAEKVLEGPLRFKVISRDVRRSIVSRFRHLILFEIVNEQVNFLGVVHGMRDLPKLIERRLEDE